MILGGIIGASLSILYIWSKSDEMDALPEDSFKEQMIIFKACIILFASIYDTSYFGMKLVRNQQEAEEIKNTSKWHLWLMNALLALMLLESYIFHLV